MTNVVNDEMSTMFKRFIVIDGPDGVGKTTQLERVWNRLLTDKIGDFDKYINRPENRNGFIKMSFPEYEQPTGILVTEMLHGKFGDNVRDLNAYFTSPMYSIDLYQAMKRVFDNKKEKLGHFALQYECCLSSRYTISNLVHQGARLHNITDLFNYMSWLFDFEYVKLGLPIPDLNIYLVAPPEVSYNAIKKRKEETGLEIDINETYEYLCDVYEHIKTLRRLSIIPNAVYVDVVSSDGTMKPIDTITNEIMRHIDNLWFFSLNNNDCNTSKNCIFNPNIPWTIK